MRQLKTELVSQKEIAASIYEAVVFHKEIDESFQPGQFVHVKAGFGSDPLLAFLFRGSHFTDERRGNRNVCVQDSGR